MCHPDLDQSKADAEEAKAKLEFLELSYNEERSKLSAQISSKEQDITILNEQLAELKTEMAQAKENSQDKAEFNHMKEELEEQTIMNDRLIDDVAKFKT